jgi:UDP-N-acetylmuramoylalanine--D-glutamate ligase
LTGARTEDRGAADRLPSAWVRDEIAVIGLARSGQSVARLLARSGARVYASDASTSADVERVATALRDDGIAVETGGHDLGRIERASLVVTSPGVPPNAAPLATARRAHVDVVSEIEIALRFLADVPYIAITGTNGKTTTTALTGRLLEALGKRAATAGNIGTPLSDIALQDDPPDWIALEVSSFQLHDAPSMAPRVGVLTNLSANHLDRYESVDSYYADKAQLFRNATPRSRWVSNADDVDVQRMVADVPGSHRFFSIRHRAEAYFDRHAGQMMVLDEPLMRRDEFPLLGDHNVANALAAVLAVMTAANEHRTEASVAKLADALRDARAMEHRIEPIGEIDGVLWINDSKSTNLASTLVALQGMTRPTVLLLGGRHKGEPYTRLVTELRRTVRAVIAYGEAAPVIEEDLNGLVPVHRLGSSFEDVMTAAREIAKPGDAVLLSPACSSYDMFVNYENRGAEFKRLARAGRMRAT